MGILTKLILSKKAWKYGKKGTVAAIKFAKRNPNLVKSAIKISTPLVAGSLAYLKHNKELYTEIPDVRDLNINDAHKILTDRGFSCHKIILDANYKYHNKKINTVIKVYPSSKKVKKDSIIKLYYLDEEILEKSKYLYKNKKNTLKNIFKRK